MRRNQRLTLRCWNANCVGWHGVEVIYVPDSWTEPGFIDPDHCPTCSGELHDDPAPYEDAIAGLLDELHVAGILNSQEVNGVDDEELLAVIQAEIERQRRERQREERGA